MDLYRKLFGKHGEEIAEKFLKKKGYYVLQKNFRIRNGEIDIICLDPTKKILVLVEVKTRQSNQFGTPFEAITPWKLKTVIHAAEFYKHTHRGLPDAMRIDAIAVLISNAEEVISIEHMENVSG